MTVEQAGLVLDASALLAYLQDESGSQLVQAALVARAVISAVNYAEVLSRLNDVGEDPALAHRRLRAKGLIGGLLEIVALTEEDATVIARLRASTRGHGLSPGDRAGLATGLCPGRPVVTADRARATLDVGVSVHLIRA